MTFGTKLWRMGCTFSRNVLDCVQFISLSGNAQVWDIKEFSIVFLCKHCSEITSLFLDLVSKVQKNSGIGS